MESDGLLHINKRSPLIPILSPINPQHASRPHFILFSYIDLGVPSRLFPSELTHLLTYLLTPWSKIFLERLTGFRLVKKNSLILWNAKLHYRIHKCPPPISILSQLDTVHNPTSYFLKIHLIIILPTMPQSPKWSLSLRFPTKTIYAPLLSPICTTCPVHLILLDFTIRTILGEE